MIHIRLLQGVKFTTHFNCIRAYRFCCRYHNVKPHNTLLLSVLSSQRSMSSNRTTFCLVICLKITIALSYVRRVFYAVGITLGNNTQTHDSNTLLLFYSCQVNCKLLFYVFPIIMRNTFIPLLNSSTLGYRELMLISTRQLQLRTVATQTQQKSTTATPPKHANPTIYTQTTRPTRRIRAHVFPHSPYELY